MTLDFTCNHLGSFVTISTVLDEYFKQLDDHLGSLFFVMINLKNWSNVKSVKKVAKSSKK